MINRIAECNAYPLKCTMNSLLHKGMFLGNLTFRAHSICGGLKVNKYKGVGCTTLCCWWHNKFVTFTKAQVLLARLFITIMRIDVV